MTEARARALGRRQPEAGLMPQSDRGSQSASPADRELLVDQGIAWSRSGKGECLDQAGAERFFGRLTRERTSTRYYRTRQAARADLIEDIALCSNRWRKHASLGYGSPNEYEKSAQAA